MKKFTAILIIGLLLLPQSIQADDFVPALQDTVDITGNTSESLTLDSDNTGAGADVDIIANQGSDYDGTLRYNATSNKWEISNDGGAFTAISTGGSAVLSGITAATATNTIANTNYAQAWNWDTLTTQNAFSLGSTSITSGKLLDLNSSATGFTGTMEDITLSGNNAANTGTLLKTTVSGNSSAAVPLMITNLGTGNSFRVNDETGDADTTPFVIDNAGNVGVGTATPSDKFSIFSQNSNVDFSGQVNSDTAGDRSSFRFYHRGSSGGATPANARMGLVSFVGVKPDNSTFTTAYFDSWITGSPSANGAYSDLRFYTADGVSGTTERLRINGDGNIGIKASDPGVALDVNGDEQLRAQGDLRFADSDSSNFVALQAPATVTGNVTWTLPATDGTSGQVLSTNGTGTLSWASAGAAPTLQNAYNGGATITTASSIPITFALASGGFTVSGAGATTFGNNTGTVAVDSSDWNISTAGAMTGISGITNDAALTTSGGAVSMNNNSNFATDINTGTSTGTVTLGGTGTQTIDIGNGVGVKTVNLGSSNTTSTTTLLSGSGGLNFNVNNNQPTNINTGTSTGAVAIGNNNAGNTLTIGGGTAMSKVLFGTCTVDPPSIAGNSKGTATCTATGTATGVGWNVFITPPNTLENTLVPQGATISGANTITVSIQNTQTATAVNGAALTWSWFAIR